MMEAQIIGRGASRDFHLNITGPDRERLISHFLLVCHTRDLSGADLVLSDKHIVRYMKPRKLVVA